MNKDKQIQDFINKVVATKTIFTITNVDFKKPIDDFDPIQETKLEIKFFIENIQDIMAVKGTNFLYNRLGKELFEQLQELKDKV